MHGTIPSAMKQFFSRKFFSLLVGGVSILLLVFLVASLDSMELRKGTPFEYVEVTDTGEMGPVEPPELGWVIIVSVVIFLLLTVFVLIFATKKQRRIILLLLLAMALAFLGIMWWITRGSSGEVSREPTPATIHTPVALHETVVSGTQIAPVVYTPPPVSAWVSIGITFLVLLVVAVLVWVFLRNRWRTAVSLEALAGIAEQAVGDLQAGKDYGDVILNCYAKMVEAANRQRGIRRRGNLTPAEFIAVLERARLPSDPVRRLTALFEHVRYGGKKASEKETAEAVTCLNEIVSAVREAR